MLVSGSLLFQMVAGYKPAPDQPPAWIRINQLGYAPQNSKVAVLVAAAVIHPDSFYVVHATTHAIAYAGRAGEDFGAYGPFASGYRLKFTELRQAGWYYIRAGGVQSPAFQIDSSVYDRTADYCLQYMRMQRNGFNPFLKDSCHWKDGYTVYAPVPDGTHFDVVGGWHDATDYLQYSSTSANATYHLLMAYRDFPGVFDDQYQANGLAGRNRVPDVIDEARWGLKWLLKMHPKPDWLFNQLGDDRDHHGFHLPGLDTNYYDVPYERPVYFCTGKPQGLRKYKNRSTGIASTAGKFASAFALGATILDRYDPEMSRLLRQHSGSALRLGLKNPGACQTAPCKEPYFYEEDNWKDDMELALAEWVRINPDLPARQKDSLLGLARRYAADEPVTPWMGADTANHYQWYPFINLGHYSLGAADYYRKGISLVWNKAKENAFYRGVPYVWCSNNLVTSFAIQCYWYRKMTGDAQFQELEQACVDWLFGCNPWGTGMVTGLPGWGDTPSDPHSSLWHLYGMPIYGGLVDGPIYTKTYRRQVHLQLFHEDPYARFQSELAVYHDDAGDYSTNEPTMDGTASLVYLLAAQEAQAHRR